MKRVLALLLFYSPLFSFATTWLVGPGKIHSKPSDVAALVNAGDTVEIDAAEYIGDVCAWTKDNLVLRGVAGRPHLRANGNNVWGKGIWVFAGNNISVDNIEFSEATVPDQNGAGIRLDGLGITVTNCYFHNNENGILTANNGGTLRIDNSEFGYNGFGDGFSHNIYIGHVDTAIIRFCYFHHANIGHELKSRARVNYILYNRISNEATGTASREIDLPNGGISILIGNIIQQGANSQNGNMIGYGLEGLTNIAPHEIYLINNTMVNERFAGSFLVAADNTQYVKAYNNIFAGPGTGITYGGSSVLDVSNNIQNNTIATMGFVNPGNYDYHVSNTSPAINAGINAGNSVGGFVLTPGLEYIHPVSFAAKAIQGTIDIGAYEFATALPVKILSFDAKKQSQQIVLQWQTANEESIDRYEINKSNDGFIFFKIGEILPKGKIINHYKPTLSHIC